MTTKRKLAKSKALAAAPKAEKLSKAAKRSIEDAYVEGFLEATSAAHKVHVDIVSAAEERHKQEMHDLLVNDHCAAFITRVRHLPGPPGTNGVIHLTFADARSIAEALMTKAGYGVKTADTPVPMSWQVRRPE